MRTCQNGHVTPLINGIGYSFFQFLDSTSNSFFEQPWGMNRGVKTGGMEDEEANAFFTNNSSINLTQLIFEYTPQLNIWIFFISLFTYGLRARFKQLCLWEYKKEQEQRWNSKLTFCIQCFKYLWRQHKEKKPTKKWRKHFNVEKSYGLEQALWNTLVSRNINIA